MTSTPKNSIGGNPDTLNHPDRPCRHHDRETFFPERSDSPQAKNAKAICRPCPVRDECLHWALDHHERGIWGATTEADRHRILRRLARTRAA